MNLIDKIRYSCVSAERYYGRRPDFVMMDRGTFLDLMKESDLYLGKDGASKERVDVVKIFGMDIVVQMNAEDKSTMKVCYYGA